MKYTDFRVNGDDVHYLDSPTPKKSLSDRVDFAAGSLIRAFFISLVVCAFLALLVYLIISTRDSPATRQMYNELHYGYHHQGNEPPINLIQGKEVGYVG